jgi:hypothetical protein
MTYLLYEQVAVSDTVLNVDALAIPESAQFVELQADPAGDLRYTLDGTEPTVDIGMVLGTTRKTIAVEDLISIQFIRKGSTDTKLSLHYITFQRT